MQTPNTIYPIYRSGSLETRMGVDAPDGWYESRGRLHLREGGRFCGTFILTHKRGEYSIYINGFLQETIKGRAPKRTSLIRAENLHAQAQN